MEGNGMNASFDYTQKPWKAVRKGDGIVIYGGRYGQIPIASMNGIVPNENNLVLMRKSPDMYELLKEFLSELEKAGIDNATTYSIRLLLGELDGNRNI